MQLPEVLLKMNGINGDKSIQCANASIMLVLNANFIKYWNYCINYSNLTVNDPNIIGPYSATVDSLQGALCMNWFGSSPTNYKIKILVNMVRNFPKYRGSINI